MDLKFRVAARIGKPVHDVFEAVADPGQLSRYFTTGGASARLEQGRVVEWEFADYPGAFPVEVVELVPDEKIVLRWDAAEGEQPIALNEEIKTAPYKTEVTMRFTPLDEGRRTLVEIWEEGWREDQDGLDASYGNCQGWAQMLAALKAWIEHGISLREGMYV